MNYSITLYSCDYLILYSCKAKVYVYILMNARNVTFLI